MPTTLSLSSKHHPHHKRNFKTSHNYLILCQSQRNPFKNMAVVDTAENDRVGGYVGWEEVCVCREKGKREIHYIMKRRDGGKDLAVIGKERSLRHMTYRFLIGFNDDTKFSNSISNSNSSKPRSRRELLDWLNSFLSSDSPSPVSPQTSGGSSDVNETAEFDVEAMKDTQLQKVGVFTKLFLWIGSSWTCKKKRRHFKAFSRNGFKISVNEFVHVLAEDNRRRVAYLDDMYEGAKGNKMVVVRWFHKIDEVGLDDFNEKEIFFSLSVQDLNIECIDGLAMVLSPLHYDKFLSVAKHTNLEPYVCNRQYDNDDVTPFDITQVKGYWKQEILKYMYSLSSSSRALEKAHLPEGSERREINNCDGGGSKPRKRLWLSRDCKVDIPCSTPKDPSMETKGVAGPTQSNALFDQRSTKGPRVTVLRIGMKVKASQQVGSLVEVLSQDSGMRGCWFRATIIKRHKSKVKLSYNDIKDAEDQEKCLEEWVLSSRIAVRDDMGLRLNGRTTIRPSIPSHKGKISWAFNVGAVVDAWQHDGWWEGIVVEKLPNETFRVFFPGEKQEAVVGLSELRHSQEWVENTWKELTERPDVVEDILADLACIKRKEESSANLKESNKVVLDLAKDDYLSQLKWKKRRRSCISVQKLRLRRSGVNSERTVSHSTIKFKIDTSDTITKGDQDNWKYKNNDHPLFSPPSVIPPPSLTSLVMSR